jgi:protein-S-isoprenylcysteine O-methyltransferase Ste14
MQTLVKLLLRIPVPWVFVLTYLAGGLLQRFFPIDRLARVQWAGIAGAACFALGVVIAGWSWLIFNREGTTTTPGDRSVTLVTRGPFRLSRNPMYIGLTLAYIGEAGLLRQVWPLLLLPIVILYVDRAVIPLEERRLHETFGDTYGRYQTRVSRWL